jgi:hypothetical protein
MKKWIKGYEGLYSIDETGKIGSTYKQGRRKGRKPQVNRLGYAEVMLHRNGLMRKVYLHKALAEAFIPNPDEYKEINHKDGNKLNNSLDNLEWSTRSHNLLEAGRLKLINGEKHWKAKMTEEKVRQLRGMYKAGVLGCRRLGRIFGIDRSQVINIVRRVNWKFVY